MTVSPILYSRDYYRDSTRNKSLVGSYVRNASNCLKKAASEAAETRDEMAERIDAVYRQVEDLSKDVTERDSIGTERQRLSRAPGCIRVRNEQDR